MSYFYITGGGSLKFVLFAFCHINVWAPKSNYYISHHKLSQNVLNKMNKMEHTILKMVV